MPTPARTSRSEIVAAARRILEAHGPDQLTMHAVAHAVGVRGPSLYKHVRDRADLMHLISNAAAAELGYRLDAAAVTGQPRADLAAMARAYRTFAHDYPNTCSLLFAPVPEDWRIDAELNEQLTGKILLRVASLSGAEHALDAARLLVAWLHGFVTMELAGAFRLGGDIDAAFDFGIHTLTAAISKRRPQR